MQDIYTTHCGLSLEEIRRNNSDLARLFSLYLNMMPTAIDGDMVKGLAEDCHISTDLAFAHCLAALAGLDAGNRDRVFFDYWLAPALRQLDPRPFLEDAYLKNIKIPHNVRGKWTLKEEKLAPFEAFVCDDFQVTSDRRMIPQIGFFEEGYAFPAVLEDGREWMTLQPNEIVTARPALRAAHGRVLAFGMGLGYFAYHAAQKEEVTSVTVVDISPDVLDLFKTHILPQFPNKNKLSLVCEDAFSFADTKMAGNFDFVFADIWHDAGDGKDLYLKMKAYEKKNPDIQFTYWLEDTIKCYLDEALW